MGEDETIASEKTGNGTSSPGKGVQDMAKTKDKGEVLKVDEKVEIKQMNGDQSIKECTNKKENGEVEKVEEDAKSEMMEVEPVAKEDSGLMKKNEGEEKEEADDPKVEEGMVAERAEKETKMSRKGKNNKEKVKEKKEPEQKTPATNRPVRERKSVERLVTSIEKDTTKEFKIEKGRGTPLKEIPNVALKISRRKTDDTFKLLHTILFGRRGKAFQIKSNISRFSGFVWRENEEKQRTKIKEKLDKCNKEKLLEFCDILDIPVAKSSTKKEDIVTKVIDFLVEPHATTTVLLAEKEKSNKGAKRKRAVKRGTGSTNSAKSQKRSSSSSKERSAPESEDESEEEEVEDEENRENENGEERSEDASEHSRSEDGNESENESDEHAGKGKDKKTASSKKESPSKAKTKNALVSKKDGATKKTPSKSSSKHTKDGDDSDETPKFSLGKKRNEKVVKEKKSSTPAKSKPSAPAKSASKEKAVKSVGKGKDKAKVKTAKPTDSELRDAIIELLKEVDINKATFTDILKQLAERFNADIMARKQSIKVMIQEELTKIAEEDDEDDDEDLDGGNIEETNNAGEGVKA